MNSTYNFLWFGLLLLCLQSCKFEPIQLAEPDESSRPLAAFIKNNYDYSILSAAIEYTGMSEELNDLHKSYTIFAPNNQAFQDIGIHSPQQIRQLDRDSLRHRLQYHILSKKLSPTNDLPDRALGLQFQTLNNDSVAIGRTGVRSYINGAELLQQDIRLANGILHRIDKLVQYEPITVQQYLEKNTQFSIFVTALKKFGLWAQLATAGPYTIMAPTNQAFANKGIDLAAIQALDPTRYYPRIFAPYIFAIDFYMRDFAFMDDRGAHGLYLSANLLLPIPGDLTMSYGLNGMLRFFIITSNLKASSLPLISLEQPAYNQGSFPLMGPGPLYDITCKNGIVHTINNILLTPDQAIIK